MPGMTKSEAVSAVELRTMSDVEPRVALVSVDRSNFEAVTFMTVPTGPELGVKVKEGAAVGSSVLPIGLSATVEFAPPVPTTDLLFTQRDEVIKQVRAALEARL